MLRASNAFKPNYPRPLQQVGVQGDVVIDVAVTAGGRAMPDRSSVVSSTNKAFTDSLLPQLAALRFRPARTGGSAVPGHLAVRFSFQLDIGCTLWEAPPRLAWDPDNEPPVVRITSCIRNFGTFRPEIARAAAKRRASEPPPLEFDTAARALRIEPLFGHSLPKGTGEIRIWTGGGLSAENELLRLVRTGNRVSGGLALYWQRIYPFPVREGGQAWESARRFVGAACTIFTQSGNREGCWQRFVREPDWRRLWDSLAALKVATLKDQVLVKHDYQLVDDGWGITVEYSDGGKYRWYSYSNPNRYTDREDSLAYAMAKVLYPLRDAVVR